MGQRIGQLLGGKYRVQQLLAVGGMGVIYGAHHELTGRSVAIKLLRPELALRPDLTRRVATEARLAVEASHPNVVEVLDAGADEDGVPYLVLERLYGRPLEALLGERLSLLATAQALLPVMSALAALHRAGIVHRDIKPSNIFVSCEGDRVVPKLLDFGIAKALEADTSTLSSVALGTPSYMAPEQALGCSTLGPATDVWSMGVVLVRCLTGRLPFGDLLKKGPSPLSFGFHPEQLEDVPESVGRVLARALQLDPRERFASMTDFRSELLAALRAVDAREPWPDASSAGYPIADSALADALHSSPTGAPDAWSSDDALRPARAHDIVTRTFSRLWQTVHDRRWSRVALGAPLLIAAGALLAVRGGAHSEQRARVTEPATALVPQTREAPASGPEDSTRAHPRAHSAVAAAAVTPSPRPEPVAKPVSGGAAAPQPAAPRRPPAGARARLPVTTRPAAPERAERTLPPEATLGPNRAPIID